MTPASVIGGEVAVLLYTSEGVARRGRVDGMGCPRLACDLLAGLVNRIHPHGRLASRSAIRQELIAAQRLVRFASDRGFTGGVQSLRRGLLVEFWMGCGRPDELAIKAMLRALDEESGILTAQVRHLIEGRTFNRPPEHEPLAPYSEAEWSRLASTCRFHIDAAFATHKSALRMAAEGEDPIVTGVWSQQNIRWLLLAAPITMTQLRRRTGSRRRPPDNLTALVHQAAAELFPDTALTISYQLLFGAYTGIVPDGLDGLGLGDIDWAGDADILLGYTKGRTSRESVNLSGKAVRLLERWLEHSAPLRAHTAVGDRQALWIRHQIGQGLRISTLKISLRTISHWVRDQSLLDDAGRPLTIHRQRIRTTFHSHRDRRAWSGSGRATIDPNHSPRVEGDNYLTAATSAQRNAIDDVIEDAQGDVLRRAQPPTVLTGAESQADSLALVSRYPDVVARLQLTNAVIAELVGEVRDVFVAACADQLSGLHGPKGQPCPARPWVCLLCPLAVFAPRHAANLLRLRAFFSRQWRQMPEDHFMAVFGPYAQRITDILDRYDPAVLTAAAQHVEDRDDELPLRPEEAST